MLYQLVVLVHTFSDTLKILTDCCRATISLCTRVLLESSLIQHICSQFIDPKGLPSRDVRLLCCSQAHYKGVTATVPQNLCLFWNFKLVWLSNYAPQNFFNCSNTFPLQSMTSKMGKNPGTTCSTSPEPFQNFWEVLVYIYYSFKVYSICEFVSLSSVMLEMKFYILLLEVYLHCFHYLI